MEENSAANNNKPVDPTPPIQDIFCLSSRIGNQSEKPCTSTKRSATEEGVDKPLAKKAASENRASLEANDDGGMEGKNLKSKDSDPKPIVEETCYFDHIPQEVKDIIFSKLVSWRPNGPNEYDPNLRLVCKSWYNTCSQNKSITFLDNKSILRSVPHLMDCGYEQLHLHFEWDACKKNVTKVDYLPEIVWMKIGPKIQSLNLSYCRLGDDVMKNVILNCENLKHLVVHLKTGDIAESFCSVNVLKALKVVRPKLETIEIHTIFEDSPWFPPCVRSNTDKWRRIFANIIRIYPNIIHFISGHKGDGLRYTYDRPSFKLEFLRELGEVDESNLISSLAHSLSGNEKKWKDAILALAKTRLTDVSLHFERSRYSEEDKAALLNFFSSQKNLKSVSASLLQLKSEIDREILRSVFIAIVDNSPELRQLEYYSSTAHLDWMNNDLSLLINPLKLDKYEIGSIKLDSKSLAYDSQWILDRPAVDWIPKYSYILYLTISSLVPDDLLQCIFQHMTSLKSLSVDLAKRNTDFALTGRRDGTVGYSIKRLQNLEILKIEWVIYVLAEVSTTWDDIKSRINRNVNVSVSDSVFYEFDFPKLRYLSCFLPKESSTYAEMASKLPSLTEIQFIQFDKTSNISLDSLLNFIQLTRKLYTLRLPQINFQSHEAEKIFKMCPSLHYLYTKGHIDFYDPRTKEVRRVSGKSSHIFSDDED